jgi:hypothetical protein
MKSTCIKINHYFEKRICIGKKQIDHIPSQSSCDILQFFGYLLPDSSEIQLRRSFFYKLNPKLYRNQFELRALAFYINRDSSVASLYMYIVEAHNSIHYHILLNLIY